MTFSIDNPEGVATTPFRKYVCKKKLRKTRVKSNHYTIIVLDYIISCNQIRL